MVQDRARSDNAFAWMSRAGSKGSKLNLSQIAGALGQQIVLGRRPLPRPGKRPLPCFDVDESSVNATGFVQNSYCLGVSPTELFSVAMSGREGLVDTAVKTATSGYLQRTLIKALEDLVVAYDGTVRTAQKQVVQFEYGNDSCNPSRVEIVRLRVDVKTCSSFVAGYARRAAQAMRLPDAERVLADGVTVRLPVNAERVLLKFQSPFCWSPGGGNDDHGGTGDASSFVHSDRGDAATWRRRIDAYCQVVAGRSACLQLHLAMALEKYRPQACDEDEAFQTLRDLIEACALEPGEAVGLLAAQSLGEPATQLTLNSFHSAGTGASGSVLHGVPRLKEILSLCKTPRTPVVRCYGVSPGAAEACAAHLRAVSLREAVDGIEILQWKDYFVDNQCRHATAWTALHASAVNGVGGVGGYAVGKSWPSAVAVLSLRRQVLREADLSAFRIGRQILARGSGDGVCVVACSPANVRVPYVAIALTGRGGEGVDGTSGTNGRNGRNGRTGRNGRNGADLADPGHGALKEDDNDDDDGEDLIEHGRPTLPQRPLLSYACGWKRTHRIRGSGW